MKKTVWFEFMNADSKTAAIEVIKRMGWDIDRGRRTFPDKDENLFEFLDMCWT